MHDSLKFAKFSACEFLHFCELSLDDQNWIIFKEAAAFHSPPPPKKKEGEWCDMTIHID